MSTKSKTQVLAINGGKPYRTRPFTSWPLHDESEVKAVADVAASGKWWRCAYSDSELQKADPGSIEGRSRVDAFEERFAKAHKVKYAVAVTSGSAALEIAMRAAGIKPGDEVITTPYTFIATSMCIMNSFGVPVYTDIDPANYNMDVGQIEGLITERTRAILPVHFSGNLCDMEKINAIAREHRLVVVEDAAHAHGVEYRGEKFAGTFGDMGCFSFQESKNVPTGEGGMLLTDDKDYYDLAFSLHHIGRLPGEIWYKHFHQAWNYRMSEFTAAIGIVQLGRLFDQNARRMENYDYLSSGLAKLSGLQPCQTLRGLTKHSHHLVMLHYERVRGGWNQPRRLCRGACRRGDSVARRLRLSKLRQSVHDECGDARPLSGRRNRVARLSPVCRARCPNAERACRMEAIWLEHRLLWERGRTWTTSSVRSPR